MAMTCGVIPLEVRKATLRSMLAKAGLGLRFNEHIEGDGPTVFAHACKLGLESIVSKRKRSSYRSGRSADWLKMKNPAQRKRPQVLGVDLNRSESSCWARRLWAPLPFVPVRRVQ
jgi:ATP-dependent DNA ligase